MEALKKITCNFCGRLMAAGGARKEKTYRFVCKGAADHSAYFYVQFKKSAAALSAPAPEPAPAPARVRGAAKELRERANRLR